MALICIACVKNTAKAKKRDSNIEKVDIENKRCSLFIEKISDKIKATTKDLKLDRKKEVDLLVVPTSLQKIAFPEVAHIEKKSKR